jgi:hypothetical protein
MRAAHCARAAPHTQVRPSSAWLAAFLAHTASPQLLAGFSPAEASMLLAALLDWDAAGGVAGLGSLRQGQGEQGQGWEGEGGSGARADADAGLEALAVLARELPARCDHPHCRAPRHACTYVFPSPSAEAGTASPCSRRQPVRTRPPSSAVYRPLRRWLRRHGASRKVRDRALDLAAAVQLHGGSPARRPRGVAAEAAGVAAGAAGVAAGDEEPTFPSPGGSASTVGERRQQRAPPQLQGGGGLRQVGLASEAQALRQADPYRGGWVRSGATAGGWGRAN